MKPNFRSISGAVLMLVIIPIFAGLLACMQVPIGNPERSRVDPELSGIWVVSDDAADLAVMMLDPWDKRTWLGAYAELDDRVPDDVEIDLSTYDGLIEAMGQNEDKTWYVGLTSLMLEKVWLTKLGGRKFMVWGPKAVTGEEGELGIAYGYNFLLTKHDKNNFSLYFINFEHEAFEDVDPEDRKGIEKVIRRHADDPDLYIMDDGLHFSRVQEQHMKMFGSLFDDVVDEG